MIVKLIENKKKWYNRAHGRDQGIDKSDKIKQVERCVRVKGQISGIDRERNHYKILVTVCARDTC